MEEGKNQGYRWEPPADAGNIPPPPAGNPNPDLPQYPPLNPPAPAVNPALPQYPPASVAPQNYPPPNPVPIPYQQPQVMVLQTAVWTRLSQPTVCPACNQQIMTYIEYNHFGSLLPWVSCLLMCLSGACCFCCFIPFCVNECKTADHFCPQCRRLLGKRSTL